jgi:hypothetical protein
MEIVAAFVPEGPLETCDACQTPAEGMTTHVGDRLCDRCKALFLAAEILFEEQISEESEVIPTMASAWYRGRADSAIEESWALEYAKGLAQFYRGLGLVGVVAGLPILRIEPTVVWPVRYDGIDLLKEIHIELISNQANSKDIAEQYRLVLLQEGMPSKSCTSGKTSWQFVVPHLLISVGLDEELESGRARRMSDNPTIPRPSFPPPSYVSDECKRLLTLNAQALDRYGYSQPMWPKKLIPACAAWCIGANGADEVPKASRPRVAAMLNRHILKASGRSDNELLLGDNSSNKDTLWRDVPKIAQRMKRMLYLIQGSNRYIA